jgi:hypothetical protein
MVKRYVYRTDRSADQWLVKLMEALGAISTPGMWPWRAAEALSHHLLRHTVLVAKTLCQKP